ncbi:MAG: hypothetical protein ACRD9W_17060, partial [Terriglobia bacterium]
MPTYKYSSKDVVEIEVDGKKIAVLSKAAYDRFNPSLLGLGDIGQKSNARDCIAAVFDLEGFTAFCNQMDPK